MSLELESLQKWYQQNEKAIFADFFHFLRFKTIATDTVFDAECKACANWLKKYLEEIGFEVDLWKTSKQPVVFAKHCKAPNRPTLLIYHHYDVQPVDPLELWKTPPFEPTLRDGNIFARGAEDNKGQCFYSLTSLKALFQLCKKINFNLKIFIEGEEESGSKGTKEVFATHGEDLKADYLLVVDSGIPAPGVPAITLGIRGILTMEVSCQGAHLDLHSGLMGGIAHNPCRALVNALSKLWDKQGKVTIPHFYDSVEEMSVEDMAAFTFDVDTKELTEVFGIAAFAPEPGFNLGQSSTIRPTVEINGISGGYTGEGFKTIIPSKASAKISCRLVPNQDPDFIFSELKKFLQSHMPKGMELKVSDMHGAPAFRSSQKSTIAKLCEKAYEDVLKRPCEKRLSGGSIPIVVTLANVSGAETVMMGYGLDTDQIHAPNEHFGLDRFMQGFLTMGRIFSRLNEDRGHL